MVSGLGHLSMPLTSEQSSQLQSLCSPAPGSVEDAATDDEKCTAWQLDSSQFQCTNPGQTCVTLIIHMLAHALAYVAHVIQSVNDIEHFVIDTEQLLNMW